jgi:hypothetical protein
MIIRRRKAAVPPVMHRAHRPRRADSVLAGAHRSERKSTALPRERVQPAAVRCLRIGPTSSMRRRDPIRSCRNLPRQGLVWLLFR